MNKEQYIIFSFETGLALVKYTCDKKFISKEEIEDAAVSYYDSDAYNEGRSYCEIVEDIMSSFEGLHYTFVPALYLNMERS